MMNKIAGYLFLALAFFYGLESSCAFQIHRQMTTPTRTFADVDSFREFDLDLAEDVANNIEKYSVEEIKACRDGLHARRVQHLAFAEDVTSPDIVKERALEVELIMQLDALKQEMPESYLFPDEDPFDSDIDTDMNSVGLLMDNLEQVDLPSLQNSEISAEPVVTEKKFWLLDILASEGVLESIAICAFLGFIMLSPETF